MKGFKLELQVTPIVAALITGSILAISSTIAYQNRQSEKVKLTRDLYNQFISIMDARSIAWFWLEELNKEQPGRSFEELWRNADYEPRLLQLYKVLSFWFLFYRVFSAKQIDNKLARSLLGYEFSHWQKLVMPLAARTSAIDDLFPDVLEPFKGILWFLPKGKILYPPKSDRDLGDK